MTALSQEKKMIELEKFKHLLKINNDVLYQQLAAHQGITSCLQAPLPLPPMRGWAISPDAASVYISKILKLKPNTILETGSGVSTLLAALALKQVGRGRVIALEHDAAFRTKTISMLYDYGVANYSQVILAPLKTSNVEGASYKYYTSDCLNHLSEKSIDLILVDGPPSSIGKRARWPLFHSFSKYFNDKATLLMDDLIREDDKMTLREWHSQGLVTDLIEDHSCEKGLGICKIINSTQKR